MILLALKSLFFVAAIFAYSTGVWRLINDYFRQEFRTFLDNEVKKNKYLMVDPSEGGSSTSPPKSPVEIISEKEVLKAKGSVPGNRLLDELIVNFGRVFTAGNGDGMRARKENMGQPPSNELISPTLTDAPPTASCPEKPVSISRTSPDPADPGDGGGGGTVIESDKFPRSSPSEQEDNKSVGNDVDDANDVDDGEEKWITYWKNREREQSVIGVGGEEYCEATTVDACGP